MMSHPQHLPYSTADRLQCTRSSVAVIELKQYSVGIEEEDLLQVGCGDFIETVCDAERFQSRDSGIMTRTIKQIHSRSCRVLPRLSAPAPRKKTSLCPARHGYAR